MSRKQIIRNVILILSITILLSVFVFSFGDISSIYSTLVEANPKYILILIGAVLLYAIIWALPLQFFAKKVNKDIRTIDNYCVSASEFFFNGITPFSSGGQPFQAYGYKRLGIKFSDSTSILMVNFIIYQIVINLFSLVAFCLYFETLRNSVQNIVIFAIIGFICNLLVLIILIVIPLSKTAVKLIRNLLVLIGKIKIFNRLIEKSLPKFDEYAIEVQKAFKDILKNLPLVLVAFVIKILSLMLFYSVPFFALLALNVNIAYNELFYVIAMTCFTMTMVTWVPTPGATGGAELAFSALFLGLGLDSNLMLSTMLLWRFFTYYLLMAYGFICYLIFERRQRKYENRDIH